MNYLYVTLIALGTSLAVVAINNRYRLPLIAPAAPTGAEVT